MFSLLIFEIISPFQININKFSNLIEFNITETKMLFLPLITIFRTKIKLNWFTKIILFIISGLSFYYFKFYIFNFIEYFISIRIYLTIILCLTLLIYKDKL